LDQEKSIANASGEASVKLRELERDAEAARTVFENLLRRAAETREQETLQVADSRIVNPAVLPFAPASPQKLQLAFIGFALGFGLAFFVSALLEFLRPTFVRPQEIEARLKLRHLASVPALRAPGAHAFAEPLSDIRSIAVLPHTAFAEAVRAIRIAVDSERRDAAEVVLLASALPGEGKSVIASNLAHLYALSGVKTLVVDADLRKGTLSRQLLPDAALGLLDCLQTGAEPRQAIVSDRSTGLHFLPAAGAEPSQLSAPELLSSRTMAAIFSELRREFDVIIVDAPPAMPVVDARILAEHADQVVLVSRWRRSPNALVRRAGELLVSSGATMTGIVVNDVEEEALPNETIHMLHGFGRAGEYRAA
jgi:capsular exopolysaccharide synthesis family protein